MTKRPKSYHRFKKTPSILMDTGPHKLVYESRWPTAQKKLPSTPVKGNPLALSPMDHCLARNAEVAMLNNAQVNRKK